MDFRTQLILLHLLTRSIYHRKPVSAVIAKLILYLCGDEWSASNYYQLQTEFTRFTSSMDTGLISGFEDYCRVNHTSPATLSLREFSLPDDFTMRNIELSEIPEKVLIWRIACVQLWNECLGGCLHVIDFSDPGHHVKSLGSLVTHLSYIVFEQVKENALEIIIRQTEYCGEDSYPVVEIDNRKVFSAMEKEEWSVGERSATESDCVFGQLYRAMIPVCRDVLRCKLDSKDRLIAVKMKGEQGLDWGGLYRETMERW